MFNKIKLLFYIIKSTKNWFFVVLSRINRKAEFKAKFRNGNEFVVTKEKWRQYVGLATLYSLLPNAKLEGDSLEFYYKAKKLRLYFGEYGYNTIWEVFGLDEYKGFYKSFNPRDKVVVDIGAALGDTAIHFILNGAKKVYAFEALPGSARLAARNIRENGFANSCELIPMAVGGTAGEVKINPDIKDMYGTNRDSSLVGEKVSVITLKQIVEKYNISDGYLKIDTEGYEYEIIQSAPMEILRKFSDIFLEYHYGVDGIVPYLEKAGFSVSYTRPRYHYMPQYEGEAAKTMFVGYIFAKRK